MKTKKIAKKSTKNTERNKPTRVDDRLNSVTASHESFRIHLIEHKANRAKAVHQFIQNNVKPELRDQLLNLISAWGDSVIDTYLIDRTVIINAPRASY